MVVRGALGDRIRLRRVGLRASVSLLPVRWASYLSSIVMPCFVRIVVQHDEVVALKLSKLAWSEVLQRIAAIHVCTYGR